MAAVAGGATGWHGVSGSGNSDREIMQMLLKFAEVGKAEDPDDTDDGSRVSVESLGHVPHAEQHKAAGLFEHGAQDLLAFCSELAETFLYVDRQGKGVRAFHV